MICKLQTEHFVLAWKEHKFMLFCQLECVLGAQFLQIVTRKQQKKNDIQN